MTDPIEEQVKVLYKLARENPEDEHLQRAVDQKGTEIAPQNFSS